MNDNNQINEINNNNNDDKQEEDTINDYIEFVRESRTYAGICKTLKSAAADNINIDEYIDHDIMFYKNVYEYNEKYGISYQSIEHHTFSGIEELYLLQSYTSMDFVPLVRHKGYNTDYNWLWDHKDEENYREFAKKIFFSDHTPICIMAELSIGNRLVEFLNCRSL